MNRDKFRYICCDKKNKYLPSVEDSILKKEENFKRCISKITFLLTNAHIYDTWY